MAGKVFLSSVGPGESEDTFISFGRHPRLTDSKNAASIRESWNVGTSVRQSVSSLRSSMSISTLKSQGKEVGSQAAPEPVTRFFFPNVRSCPCLTTSWCSEGASPEKALAVRASCASLQVYFLSLSLAVPTIFAAKRDAPNNLTRTHAPRHIPPQAATGSGTGSKVNPYFRHFDVRAVDRPTSLVRQLSNAV